jgi:hypothetical protein
MAGTIFSFMLVGDAVLELLMGIDMSITLSTLRARLGGLDGGEKHEGKR